jgi:hypothetical protein
MYNLSVYMNERGEHCWPSITQQARDCSLNERSIYRSLNEAVQHGFLDKTQVQINGRLHNNYHAKYPLSMTPVSDTSMTYSQTLSESHPTPGTGSGDPCQKVQGNSSINTSSNSSKKEKEKETKKKKKNPSEAEEIYELYPRKVGHKTAISKIEEALKSISFEELKKAVIEYRDSPHVRKKLQKVKTKEFIPEIPHPDTWFNQERWLDDRSAWGYDAQNSSTYDENPFPHDAEGVIR